MRRLNVAALACVLLACTSSPISAAIIRFPDVGSERDFYFDRDVAWWDGPLGTSVYVDGNPVFVDDYHGDFSWPWATYESGPRMSLTLLYDDGVHVESIYQYAPGVVTLTFGRQESPLGTFKAPTLPVTFSVRWENGGHGPCPCAYPVPIELEAGKFSESVASALGVHRYTAGGLIELWREISAFLGVDEPREGFYNGGSVTIVTAVPEPSVGALVALAAPAAALWHLRRWWRGSRTN